MNYGLHVIQFPSGRFGYAGSIPSNLGELVPAGVSDVMAGRVCGRAADGTLVTVKFPSFETRDDAIAHATGRGARPI